MSPVWFSAPVDPCSSGSEADRHAHWAGGGPVILVSACLAGIACRYDGASRPVQGLITSLQGSWIVPVCPEQLGGLPTPRPAAEIRNGDGFDVIEGEAAVMTEAGMDVTEHFLRGAEQASLIARKLGGIRCILKSGSPSCGLTPAPGVTAARLLLDGYDVEELG